MPLIVLLLLYNTGFSLAVVQVSNETKPLTWVAVSWYLSATAIFFAAMLGTNTQERLALLMRGTMMAAMFASLIAILAYFRALGPASNLFLMYDRAHATFNDPNVLGAFLVLPALLALQRVLNGRLGDAFRASILFGVFAVAVLLTFSRAAWGMFAFTAVLLMFFTFVTSRSPNERARIVLIAIAGVLVMVLMLAALLSVDRVAELFKAAREPRPVLRRRPSRPLRPPSARRAARARAAVRHRAAAVPQGLPRGPAQHLPQQLPFGRLALGLRLPHDGVHHADPRPALRVRRHAVAARPIWRSTAPSSAPRSKA